MLDIEKLIKEKERLPHLAEIDNLILSSNVESINHQECYLNLLVIDSDNMEASNHPKVKISFRDLSISDIENSLTHCKEVEKYILDNVLSKVTDNKDRMFDRWFQGRISFCVNKRKNVIDFSNEFEVSDTIRDFVIQNKLESDLEFPIDNEINKLKARSVEILSHCKQKGKKSFSDEDVYSKLNTYHFDLNLESFLEDSLLFYCNEDLIHEYHPELNLEDSQIKWVTNISSPFFCKSFASERKKRVISYFVDDIASSLQTKLNEYIESTYKLEELSETELEQCDEIREVRDMSLRKETPLYKYYIKEGKVLIEKFILSKNEWEFI